MSSQNWDMDEAKDFVMNLISSGKTFNVIYVENDAMAFGVVQALDNMGITHGIGGEVIIISFDCSKRGLEEVLGGNWNYNGQCSPSYCLTLHKLIQSLENGI